MRPANILHLGIKEIRGLLRDTTMLVLIVYSFTLAIYTQTKAVPETLNRAAIAIVDEDRSPLSSRIVTAFYPPYFTPPRVITATEMDRRMDAGLDTFALDIPPQFPARPARRAQARDPAQHRCDADDPGLQRQCLHPEHRGG